MRQEHRVGGNLWRVPSSGILGHDPVTVALRELLDEVIVPAMAAPCPDPILILGPTGSGTDVVARYLHQSSVRSRGAWVGLNCATFKGEILEAKLFGHARGSFTGATADADGVFVAAHGGVLLLDEVGDMPEEGQVMLLRAIETRSVRPVGARDERSVDVQVICATNVDLEEAVREGRFRSDLYHRINGLTVQLVALRARRGDLRDLLAHYLAHHEERLGKRTGGLSAAVLDLLERYDWPGNVRELQRACSLLVHHTRRGEVIDLGVLARALPQVCAPTHAASAVSASDSLFDQDFASYEDALRAFERAFLEIGLRKHNWNRAALARHLQLSRATMYRYLLRAGLSRVCESGSDEAVRSDDDGEA